MELIDGKHVPVARDRFGRTRRALRASLWVWIDAERDAVLYRLNRDGREIVPPSVDDAKKSIWSANLR
jgi:hypothetical protein